MIRRLFFLFLLLVGTANAQDLSSGLVIHLELDEGSGTSIADEAGNFTCTASNESWTTDGTYGDVYVSSATNNISCGAVSVPISTTFTIAFWMLETSEPGANNYIISKYNTVTSGRSFRVYVASDEDSLLQVSSDGANNEIQEGTDNLPNGSWVHVMMTFSSGAFDVYYDNTLVTDDGDFSTHTSVFDSTTNSTFYIGSDQLSANGFAGNLRHLAIWNRVLTSGERALVFADTWASAPSFSAGPTITPATDGYTVSGTVDIDATVYAVACLVNSTAPTIAQVKAGDCTGDADALIAANEAWTGTSADSFALTGSGEFPIHDVYVVASAAGGDSSLSTHADELRSPDSGQAIVTLTSVSATSPCDDDDYFDPDVATGDVIEYDTTSANTYTVTIGADCDVEIAAGGDTSQDNFDLNYCDVSSACNFSSGPPNWPTDDTIWVNNNAPTALSDPIQDPIVFDEDEAIATFDVCAAFDDADDDQLTITVTNGTLPNGLSLGGTGNCELTGTPDTEDESGVTIEFTATDIAGATATANQTFYVVNTVTMPDCVDDGSGDDVSACLTKLNTAYPWIIGGASISTSGACSDTVTAGQVLSTDPEASEETEAYPSFSAVVSTGECPVWDMTGIPLGWSSVANALADKEFVAIMRQEADGDGVWAYWLPGAIHGSANLRLDLFNVREEADTNAAWARWAPGAPHNSANLQIDLQAALTADFVVTP